MNCPKCNAEFKYSQSVNTKRGALTITCECPECGAKLSNDPTAELARAAGIFTSIFGVLSFGGSWPVPALPVAASAIVTLVGLSAMVYGFKKAKFVAH